jgi:adenine phosphoribosyltransferase
MNNPNKSRDNIVAAKVVRRCGVPDGVRVHRILHALDGIESTVTPDALTDAGARLWFKAQAEIEIHNVDYLLGLDGGGILATVAVSIASQLPFKLAWKLDLDLPDKVTFTERSAVRPHVFAYGLQRGERTILVDDEISTGLTALSAAHALREIGLEVTGVLALIEDERYSARALLADAGIPLITLSGVRS